MTDKEKMKVSFSTNIYPDQRDLELRLIETAVELISSSAVSNIDIVVISEQLRISPYAGEIRETLAQTIGIDKNQVSVKGKSGNDLIPNGMQILAVALIKGKNDVGFGKIRQ